MGVSIKSSRRVLHAPGLFGEATALLEPIHCETIAVRSTRHSWELAPHRHPRLHQVLWMEQGAGTVEIDGVAQALADDSLVVVAPGDVHAFRFRADARGLVLTLSDEFVDAAAAAEDSVRTLMSQSFVAQASAELARCMAAIGIVYSASSAGSAGAGGGSGAAGKRLLLHGHCQVLLGELLRSHGAPDLRHGNSQQRLVRRFEHLLDQHHLQHWSASRYAAELAVTPTRLGRATQAVRGVTPTALIAQRLMREARRRLSYSGHGVSEVAYSLGFRDPAYFTRVFTRSVGSSPRAYRRAVGERA